MSQSKTQSVWCRTCEQYVKPGLNGKPVGASHKARCGRTCDPQRLNELFSEHTPVPGTLERHHHMDECGPEKKPCPKKRRLPREKRA